MDDRYYIKLHNEQDWYVFDSVAGVWIAKCHAKENAELVCNLLNTHT
jgi:hypothetical protein